MAASLLQTTFGGSANVDAFVSKVNAAGSALAYSTYLGGSNDDTGRGIAVDAAGNAYVVGHTSSSNFPVTPGAFQTTFSINGVRGFVSKLNAAGSALVYSTYLGGSSSGHGADAGTGIAVDAAGNAYVTGGTSSLDFPTTPGAFQTVYGGNDDAFVSKLNATGSALVYSTYLGGSDGEGGSDIAVDAAGNAYVTGYTYSSNFPTTPGAFQTAYGGNVDAFVSKLNASGSALVYFTYLGGSNDDTGRGIAVDAAGNAYVTGDAESANFPTTAGAFQSTFSGGGIFSFGDAFVSKLHATGSALVYSTYLGGSEADEGVGIAIDASGNAYVTGVTSSSNFPITADAFQATFGGIYDAFVTKLNGAGSDLVYSTYLGRSGNEGGFGPGGGIAVDAIRNAYVTGNTTSADFPTTQGAFKTSFSGGFSDVFVSKLSPSITYEYDFYAPGTTTVAASFRFPGFVRDVSPASTPIKGFTGFIPPSPASLVPCDLLSNSSGELDCRPPTVHGGIFYFIFDFGAFPRRLGLFTGGGFTAPDGATPGLGTVKLLNGQIIDVSAQP